MGEHYLDADSVRRYCEKIFSRHGFEEEDCRRIVDVILMADLYGDPKLMNWYCREKCPLGGEVPVVEDQTIEKLTLRALASLRKTDSVKDMLLDIMADGVVTADELPDLQEIIATLDELNEINQNLKNWIAQYQKKEE